MNCSGERNAVTCTESRWAATRLALAAAALLTAWGAGPAFAEPIFLSKQYARCTACHYSESGGGLLTPYGRSLSREEISTFGRQGAGVDPAQPAAGEEGFLFGAAREREPAAARPRHAALASGRQRPRPHPGRPQFPHDPRPAGGLAARPLDRLRHGRTPAPRRRRPGSLLRALGRLPGDRRGERAWRTLPARLRRPVRRPHLVHPRTARPRPGRSDLRRRGGRVDRSDAAAGIRRPWPRRIADRRRRTRRVHRKRPVPDRRRSPHRPRGIRPLPRHIGGPSVTHPAAGSRSDTPRPPGSPSGRMRTFSTRSCGRAAAPTSSPTRRRSR